MPTRIPNLLVNGASGIAVGMATNIPPHNLGEVIEGALALLDNPELTIDELCEFIPAPDFPTGGIIIGRAQIINAFKTGRGSFTIRAKTHFEDLPKNRKAIIVSEIPYQVNKSKMIEKMADLVRDKSIEGISDLRDESDRSGVRVVIELKSGQQEEVILAQLLKFTQMEQRFSINMLALNGQKPETFNLRTALKAFLTFRDQIIIRRTRWHLTKARAQAHILAGLLVATHNIDPVIALIRGSANPQDAREKLMAEKWQVAEISGFLERIDRIVSSNPKRARDSFDYRISTLYRASQSDFRFAPAPFNRHGAR